MKHNKLVRDKIPDICRQHGEVPETRVLTDDAEYLSALTDKLCEEAAEVRAKPSLEELADTLEVVHSIGKTLGYSVDDLETARLRKASKRGGFDTRTFLIGTTPKK